MFSHAVLVIIFLCTHWQFFQVFYPIHYIPKKSTKNNLNNAKENVNYVKSTKPLRTSLIIYWFYILTIFHEFFQNA